MKQWPVTIPGYILGDQTDRYAVELVRSLDSDTPIVPPLFGVIVLTRLCESACVYCPYHQNTFHFEMNQMRVDDARHCIDELASFGVKHLQLSGGEPLLHPAIIDLELPGPLMPSQYFAIISGMPRPPKQDASQHFSAKLYSF